MARRPSGFGPRARVVALRRRDLRRFRRTAPNRAADGRQSDRTVRRAHRVRGHHGRAATRTLMAHPSQGSSSERAFRPELVGLTVADVTLDLTDDLHVRMRTSKTDQGSRSGARGGLVRAQVLRRGRVSRSGCHLRAHPGGGRSSGAERAVGIEGWPVSASVGRSLRRSRASLRRAQFRVASGRSSDPLATGEPGCQSSGKALLRRRRMDILVQICCWMTKVTQPAMAMPMRLMASWSSLPQYFVANAECHAEGDVDRSGGRW